MARTPHVRVRAHRLLMRARLQRTLQGKTWEGAMLTTYWSVQEEDMALALADGLAPPRGKWSTVCEIRPGHIVRAMPPCDLDRHSRWRLIIENLRVVHGPCGNCRMCASIGTSAAQVVS